MHTYEGFLHVSKKLNEQTPGDNEKNNALYSHAAESSGNAVKIARNYTCTTLPYPITKYYCRGFGGVLEPHYIVGAEPLDQ